MSTEKFLKVDFGMLSAEKYLENKKTKKKKIEQKKVN